MSYFIYEKKPDYVSHCVYCGDEIYSEETCFLRGSGVLCSDCADEDDVPMIGYELDAYFKRIYGG